MPAERSYSNLTLHLENLDKFLQDFFSTKTALTKRSDTPNGSQRTIKFGRTGIEDATVVLFFKQTGTTTIQFKTGKNHELGKELADFLFETIDIEASPDVALSLSGFDQDSVALLIADLSERLAPEGGLEFDITKHTPHNAVARYEIRSTRFKDCINITTYATNKLLIQGKRLFTYKNITYSLSILLDQASLLSVISCSDGTPAMIREEVALEHVEKVYAQSFKRMDPIFRNLLTASYCVKLSSVTLPDYSMLLYPDLRVLEGVIKLALTRYGNDTDTAKIEIGSYFDCTASSSSIKSAHLPSFTDSSTINPLETCYTLYRQHRHGLFHMNEMVATSRVVTTIGETMKISADIASAIENLYQNCPRL